MTKYIRSSELENILLKLDSDLCFCLITSRNPKGYPVVLLEGDPKKTELAQTFVYKKVKGAVIFGLHEVHHTCETKRCINPRHLERLSRSDHAKRHAGKFCIHGHERTPENIYYDSHGWQSCRQCRKDAEARRPPR